MIKKLEGIQTVETVSEILNLSHQSAINYLSKLKSEGHVKVHGGGKQKRMYTITQKIIYKKKYPGMFDILNKYSTEKINPPFDHIPHNPYSVEEAIVDLIEFDEIRILINIPRLFNHITNWSKVYQLAKKKELRKKIGALYDLSKQITKVKKIPEKTRELMLKSIDKNNFQNSSKEFLDIENMWNIKIPFNKKDLEV